MITFLATTTACQTDLFFGKVEGVGGTVLAPNGRTPSYKAKVAIRDLEPGGYAGETLTAATGEFLFKSIPDALYRIDVYSPNGLFETGYYAEVEDGHSPGGIEVNMAPVRAGTFFDVPGRYDDVGVVLSDLGYLYRTIDVDALAQSTNPLAGAEVAFLGSGIDAGGAEDERVVANLRSFVAAGGRLIVSDRAWPFVKAAWPGKINWGADPAVGNGGQEIEATLSEEDLKRCLTVAKWRIKYDLGAWALPESTAGTVFVRGDVATTAGPREGAPLLVGFDDGAGFVAFSTFEWRTQYADGRLPVRVLNYLIANE
ncbi:MAG TPA: hypothetical protein VMW93_01980 [bacterium]|nr:hypothetical protein [bacterium]